MFDSFVRFILGSSEVDVGSVALFGDDSVALADAAFKAVVAMHGIFGAHTHVVPFFVFEPRSRKERYIRAERRRVRIRFGRVRLCVDDRACLCLTRDVCRENPNGARRIEQVVNSAGMTGQVYIVYSERVIKIQDRHQSK